MPVYVDPCLPYPHLGERTGHLLWCHLMADTRDELHAFADRLGLPRRAFQDHAVRWHYDIPLAVRTRALALGARDVDRRTIGLMLRERRSEMPPA